ncbi:MAG: phage baseplate assembly protein V [Cetobacterium sp.]
MIKIEKFENIIYLDKFEIHKEINEHSYCKFIAQIKESDLNHYYSNLNKRISIELGSSSNKKETVFFGIVKSIEGKKEGHNSKIEVEIISISYLESIEKNTRVFQNPEKKIEDVFECLKMKEIKVDLKSDFKNQKIEIPIFQNKESNFDFIKNIAKQLGSYLVVDDISNTNFTLKIGFSQQDKIDLSNEEYNVKSLKIDMDNEEIKVILQKKLFIGDIFVLNGEEYEIIKSLLSYEKSIYIYTYIAIKNKKSKNIEIESFLNENRYEGIVIDNKDPEMKGRIKIKFNEKIEDSEPGDGYWYEFLTPYSGQDSGMIFIPEIEDNVIIKSIGEKIYSENSIRSKSNNKLFEDPNIKIIKNIYGKSITFSEKMIEIKSGDEEGDNSKVNFIRLIDEKLEISIGKKKILIDDDRIVFENEKVQLEISDKIKLFCGETGIVLDTGKIEMEAKEVNLEGKEINLKGKKINLN